MELYEKKFRLLIFIHKYENSQGLTVFRIRILGFYGLFKCYNKETFSYKYLTKVNLN